MILTIDIPLDNGVHLKSHKYTNSSNEIHENRLRVIHS